MEGEFSWDMKVPKEFELLAANDEAIRELTLARNEIDECIAEVITGTSLRYPNAETVLGFEGYKILTEGPRVFEISCGNRKVKITIELAK